MTQWDGETVRAFDARNEVEPYKVCRGTLCKGQKKPRSSFHRSSATNDGRARICRACKSHENGVHYKNHIEWFRDRDANIDPQVKRARSAARKLKFPALCESCGRRPPTDRHHDNYGAPLSVRFLCKSCHESWHLTHDPAFEEGEEPVRKIRPAPRWREDEQRKAA